MPADIPGGDFEGCVGVMTEEEGHDEESARNICGALQEEAKSDHGDPDALLDALERGAGLIADVGVDLVSGVDVPAVDSKWVMTKDGGGRKGHDYRATTPVLLAKDESTDKRITYAAAMIPREPDKEGDVVATPTVEKAAHDFLKQDGGIDTDHSLIDGEGTPVESWVLKEDRTFDLPDGGTETYGAGTWMLGIEWGAEAWDRIQAGELTGLSIYGMADHVALGKAATCPNCGEATPATHKRGGGESDGMAPDNADDGGDPSDGETTDDGPTLKDLREDVTSLSENLEAVKEAVETEKDAQDAAAELANEYDVQPGDVLDIVEAAARHDTGKVLDAIDTVGSETAEADAKEDGEDDDEEDEKTVDKRADEANLDKGGDATDTAQKGITDDGDATSGTPSYKALAKQAEAED